MSFTRDRGSDGSSRPLENDTAEIESQRARSRRPSSSSGVLAEAGSVVWEEEERMIPRAPTLDNHVDGTQQDLLLESGAVFAKEHNNSTRLRKSAQEENEPENKHTTGVSRAERHARVRTRREPRYARENQEKIGPSLFREAKVVGSSRAYDSSDIQERTCSPGSEHSGDYVNLFDLLGRPTSYVSEPYHITTLPETNLVETATDLALRWLAEGILDELAKFSSPFGDDQFGKASTQAPDQSKHPIPGLLVYGTSGNAESSAAGRNRGDGQREGSAFPRNDKRRRSPDSNGENDGAGSGGTDGGEPPPGKKRGQCIDRLLACPYYKHDPVRYSAQNMHEMEYRGCAGRFLPHISRLKQHLHRVHEMPKAYCGRCFRVFTKQAQLDQHLQSETRCPLSAPLFQERMTEEQAAEIKKKSPRNSVEENWFAMWHILFPGNPLPASPYMDDVNDNLQDFFHFFRHEGPAALLAGFEAIGASPPSHIAVEDVTQMLETSISCIFSNWNNARSGSNVPQAVPQHMHIPGAFPSVTISVADAISARARLPQTFHPVAGTAHAMTMTPNASTGGSSLASSPPFEIYPLPQIAVTSSENYVDEPSYFLDDGEAVDFTKILTIPQPLVWNWDQVFAEQQ